MPAAPPARGRRRACASGSRAEVGRAGPARLARRPARSRSRRSAGPWPATPAVPRSRRALLRLPAGPPRPTPCSTRPRRPSTSSCRATVRSPTGSRPGTPGSSIPPGAARRRDRLAGRRFRARAADALRPARRARACGSGSSRTSHGAATTGTTAASGRASTSTRTCRSRRRDARRRAGPRDLPGPSPRARLEGGRPRRRARPPRGDRPDLINTPECLISEGLAELGHRFASPPESEADLLVELYGLAGLPIAADPAAAARRRGTNGRHGRRRAARLGGASADAALMRHADGSDPRRRARLSARRRRSWRRTAPRSGSSSSSIRCGGRTCSSTRRASGSSASWLDAVPPAERPARFGRLLHEQLTPGAIVEELAAAGQATFAGRIAPRISWRPSSRSSRLVVDRRQVAGDTAIALGPVRRRPEEAPMSRVAGSIDVPTIVRNAGAHVVAGEVAHRIRVRVRGAPFAAGFVTTAKTSPVWASVHGWCWTSVTGLAVERRSVKAVADREIAGAAGRSDHGRRMRGLR